MFNFQVVFFIRKAGPNSSNFITYSSVHTLLKMCIIVTGKNYCIDFEINKITSVADQYLTFCIFRRFFLTTIRFRILYLCLQGSICNSCRYVASSLKTILMDYERVTLVLKNCNLRFTSYALVFG